jgi:hypothetical protein
MKTSKLSNLAHFAVFIGFVLFVFGVPFALLRGGTLLPLWADIFIAIPTGAALFYLACKWADM